MCILNLFYSFLSMIKIANSSLEINKKQISKLIFGKIEQLWWGNIKTKYYHYGARSRNIKSKSASNQTSNIYPKSSRTGTNFIEVKINISGIAAKKQGENIRKRRLNSQTERRIEEVLSHKKEESEFQWIFLIGATCLN